MDPQALENEARSAIAGASTLAELDDARVRYLGRRSELKQALREVRDAETGSVLNILREGLEQAVTERQAELERAELDRRLTEEVADITLPGEARPRGRLHLITQIRREVEDIFLGLGYQVVDGREVETTRYNFDGLNFPADHPARSPLQSLFLNGDVLLRTETSPSQIRVMETQPPPIYMVSLGRVYRRDTPDATHTPIFHQIEGLAIDRGITMADLKGTLLHMMRALFGEEREMRFRTHDFPFTEPSPRARRQLLPLRGPRLLRVPVLRLDRDRRLRHGRPDAVRVRRPRPRGVDGIRLRHGPRARRHAPPRPARARPACGRTTSGS